MGATPLAQHSVGRSRPHQILYYVLLLVRTKGEKILSEMKMLSMSKQPRNLTVRSHSPYYNLKNVIL